MKIQNFLRNYKQQTKQLLKRHNEKEAMSLAVGGDFEAAGAIQFCLLVQSGLQKNDTIVDVGCGSGRLAFTLKEFLTGKYIGTDIAPDLYKYAEKICNRADWKFSEAPGLTIPLPDDSADFICFFSVFTHLLHEETYKYLEDARRVIKPGGKIIFSFLEFAIPCHWDIFRGNLDNVYRADRRLDQFFERDAIRAWTEHLDLKILEITDSDKPHIALDRLVKWDNGTVMEGIGNLGQSICILTK